MTMIALSTGSLYTYGLARVVGLAAEAGFDGVELMVDRPWDARQPAYVRQLAGRAGLPILAVHSPFVPDVPGWPLDEIGRLESSCALARCLGAGLVVAHLPHRFCAVRVEMYGLQARPRLLPLPLPRRGPYRAFLSNGLAAFEAEQRVRIGVENMPSRRLAGRRLNLYAMNDVETLAGLPHLTLDTTHVGTWGLDLLAVYERLQERIVHVHLSNYDGQEHRLPDRGHLPLAELLRRLARDRYEGVVTLELGPDVLEAENENKVLAHLRRALHFCQENLCCQKACLGV